MKKTITLLTLSFIITCMTISCKEESSIFPTQNKVIDDELSKIETSETKIETPIKLVSFVANGKQYLVSKTDFFKLKQIKSTSFLKGIVPATVTGSLSQIGNNVKIYIGGFPQYVDGNYFCKTYQSSASVTVPSGSFVLFSPSTAASIPGRNSIYVSTAGTGCTMNQYGNTYVFNTYSVMPTLNIIGKAVSQYPLPQNIIGNVFSYSVYTP